MTLIQEGDYVVVYFDNASNAAFEGTVHHIPTATGDSWIIESASGLHYINTFAQIVKTKP